MRLIIDTDTAGDDCFSILLALADSSVALEAVTICNGNIGFDQQVENALYTLEVAGRSDVPVFPGARRPLMRAPVDAEYVFGADGMSDAGFPRAARRPEPQNAVQAMIDLVMANPGEITILAQAPLTNLALAAAQEPEFAKAVRHLWIMGGTDNALGNVTPAAEFNFYVDPDAARMVLAAGFSATVVTWTVTVADSELTEAELARIAAMDTTLSRFFTQVNAASVAFSRDRYDTGATLHPDALACACMLDESLILEAAERFMDIETEGRLTRGYSSVSSSRLPDQQLADPALGRASGPNIRLVQRADRARFSARMMAMLQSR